MDMDIEQLKKLEYESIKKISIIVPEKGRWILDKIK